MLPPISPQELVYQLKHYDDNLAPQLLGAIVALVSCATVATALRFWARHISGAKLQADDWTIAISTFCIWGLAAIGVVSVRDGLGKHAVRVGIPGVLKFLKSEYIFEQVYTVGVSMTKISILLFYLRLFRGKRFKRCVYAIGLFVVLWAITVRVNASGGVWSNIEPSVGIVCANLPILRPLFKTYITKPMGSLSPSSVTSKYHKYAPWASNKPSQPSKDTPVTTSTTWVSQGTTQVSTGRKSVYWKSPNLFSTEDHAPLSTPQQVMWGGRLFRPHKDSRFADASEASVLDTRGEITIDEQEVDIAPPHSIRVRRDVEWSSADKPLPPLPPRGGLAAASQIKGEGVDIL
ncbi:MAG: hypothetical protein M1814_004541 [Vezdaea aestivalis]|nr:MAG: hypothetical protein M1814_004541 [Vezdaea aestivalis]